MISPVETKAGPSVQFEFLLFPKRRSKVKCGSLSEHKDDDRKEHGGDDPRANIGEDPQNILRAPRASVLESRRVLLPLFDLARKKAVARNRIVSLNEKEGEVDHKDKEKKDKARRNERGTMHRTGESVTPFGDDIRGERAHGKCSG